MAKKNSDQIAAKRAFLDILMPRLETLGDITSKSMFGGFGIFYAGSMFALITSDAELYFKADETNLHLYKDAGSDQHFKMPYYRVPDSVLKSDEQLHEWATKSLNIVKES